METFAYEVAISFAGEQRPEAEAIANCLTAAGVKVFFDEYEQAALWGKDLYEHLAEVYQHKARYCLTLVSADYAAKVWTTHERRNAQARALAQKTEYILPVRFDDTELPGLPTTVGYVRFADQGSSGICDLVLKKLGKVDVERSVTQRVVTTSPRACILDPEQSLQACIPVVECTWGSGEATLGFQPDDSTDGPFLDGLRESRHQLHVAFKNNVGLCRVEDVRHVLKAGLDQWVVQLRIENADFTPTMEIGMQGLSADDIAEQRARRILLNEHRYSESKGQGVAPYNDALKEVLLRGVNTLIKPTGSPFPGLYERYGRQPMKFLEFAWITAVLILKTSGVVAEVTSLVLTTHGDQLLVNFNGKRRKQYNNRPATTINISGVCPLVNKNTT